MTNFYICLIFILNAKFALLESPAYVTQTVYGFLDFTTTIENTVMIFSPQSAPVLDIKGKITVADAIETKPAKNVNAENGIKPTKLSVTPNSSNKELTNIKKEKSTTTQKATEVNSIIGPVSNSPQSQQPRPQSSVVYVANNATNPTLHVENNIYEPEYDLLSRQPAEYAEETYRVINLKSKSPKDGASRVPPVSTRKSLGSSMVHATRPQSSLHVQKNDRHKIRPSSSSPLRVLKTNAPLLPNSNTNLSANRKRNRSADMNDSNSVVIIESTAMPEQAKPKKTSNRHKAKRRNKSRSSSKKSSSQASIATSTAAIESPGRRAFRPKIQPSSVVVDASTPTSTSLYMFKLNRTPGRWQYKSPPKPRVPIRKSQSDILPSVAPGHNSSIPNSINEIQNGINTDVADLEASDSHGNGAISNGINQDRYFVETLNVEISTPANLKNTYYEIATIKSPVAYQVNMAGSVKKTRYITTTSTFEKTLSPEPTTTEVLTEPLTQNILEATAKSDDNGLLDGSITTLSTLYLGNDAETPVLETITESFSITQLKLRTQVLPIVREQDQETSYLTLIQTYDITSLLTVTKTLSPAEQFVPSLSFKDFRGNLDEAGSEINLELEFGDETNGEAEDKPYLDAEKVEFKVKPLGTSAPLPAGFTILTTTYPVIRLETAWSTNIVPIINGQSTSFRTLSKSIGSFEKTEYKTDTATVPIPPPIATQPINPYLLPVQQLQTITSSYVYESVATQTNSKILKLTFGARTAYTTIYTTEIKPSLFTNYVTTSVPVPVQPTYPGYFPPPGYSPPYPPYPFLG